MANRHFAEIGDIWKHLPLAEILTIEHPKYYCESHAGSARYPLTHSAERDYGVYHFFEHASLSPSLERSAFCGVLRDCMSEGMYPGSPWIALTVLAKSAQKFLFCDMDPESLQDIWNAGESLGLGHAALETTAGDGIAVLEDRFANVSSFHADRMFAFIDPYDPLETSINGMNAFDLFYYLTWRDVKTVLWYGYDTLKQRDQLARQVKKPFIEADLDIKDHYLWCGDICLDFMDRSAIRGHPGVFGCRIVCGNLSPRALSTCEALGGELEKIYASARFQDKPAALRFLASPLIGPTVAPEETSADSS